MKISSTEKVNIIIAVDRGIFNDGLWHSLNDNKYVDTIHHAKNEQQIIAILKKNSIHLIFIDITLPDLNGTETTKLIKENFPDVKIIAMAYQDEIIDIDAIVKAGASGYLSKATDGQELHEALYRVVYQGIKYFSQEIGSSLLDMNNTEENEKTPKIKFTKREKEFLKLANEGKSYKEIADNVTPKIKSESVGNSFTRMHKKTGAGNLTELLIIAKENGDL